MANRTPPLKKPLAAKLPWNDKAGRLAPLKAVTFALLFVPPLWLLGRALTGDLGPRPYTEAIHFIGDWTIYTLLIVLAITPARRLLDWSKLIQVRRMIGIAALCYILLHFTLYIADSRFDLMFVWREIIFRIYLTIGITAIIGLVALGVTSTDGMIRRLGAKSWNTLHRLIYAIGILALIHFYMQSKLDVSRAVLFSGFFIWEMGYRVMARFGIKEGLAPLLGLAVVSAFLTAVAEATWYGVATGIGFSRVFAANFQFASIRPAWWVLAAGIGVAAVAEVRRRMRAQPRGRVAATA